jgi:hypothetical protein
MHIIQTLFSWLRCELTEQGHRVHDHHNSMSPDKELFNPLEWIKNGTVCIHACMYVCTYVYAWR